jgi:hypothetical protein
MMNDHCDAVLAELQRISDVARYVELRRRLAQVDVSKDLAFQELYRAYWKMNVARLGDRFYTHYFARMESLKGREIDDIDGTIRDLALISNTTERPSLQFSLATKLLNTVDSRTPVYDSNVSMFYFFDPPPAEQLVETRLAELLSFYGFLRAEYARIVREGLLDVCIARFRERFTVALDNERVIDLLIWGFTSLLRNGAQRKGGVKYG